MLFSNKDLIKIVIPLIIEQTLAITIGMIDSMMVSSVGEAAVSGVSLVDTLNLLLIYLFSALATGGAVVASQFLGRRDEAAACKAAKQLTYVVFAVALAIAVITLVFRTSILTLIFGSIEQDVMRNAVTYLFYSALSYPFLALYNSGAAVFRALGNSKISMMASLLMNVINVAGNALLIFVLEWGVAGAAIATLFSRMVGAAVMMVLVHNKHNPIHIQKLFSFKPDFAIIKSILKIGVPNGLENGMFQFGKLLTQSLISTFGTVAIAANAVGNSMTSMQYIPGTAIGLSMVSIIGRCVGAGEKEQAKLYTKKLMVIAYASIIAITAVMLIFVRPIIGIYNLSEASSELARQLMIYHSICVCTYWPLAFTIPNAFRAASDVKYPLIISVVSMWLFRVGLSYVFALWFDMGVFGVWIAMTSDWLFRAIFFTVRFIRGRWLTKYRPISVNTEE